MSDAAPERSRRWWLPGLVAGALAAGVAFAVVKLTAPTHTPPPVQHRAEAHLQLPTNETAQRIAARGAMMRAPDFITRVLADPTVAALETVRAADNPVSAIAERLTFEAVAPDVLAVRLTGTRPDDLKVVVERVATRYSEEEIVHNRNAHEHSIKCEEAGIRTLRAEVEAADRVLALVNRVPGDDPEKRLAILHLIQIETEVEFDRLTRDMRERGDLRDALKEQLSDKAAPDPQLLEEAVSTDPRVLKAKAALDAAGAADAERRRAEYDAARARVTSEATKPDAPVVEALRKQKLDALERERSVQREQYDKLWSECVAYRRLLRGQNARDVNLDGFREELRPRRELLTQCNTKLAALRAYRGTGTAPLPRGTVTVEPLAVEAGPAEPPARDRRAYWVPAAAFAGAFALGALLAARRSAS
jgi:hypothetical protein